MKLEQFVSERCKVTYSLNTIDAVENSIFLNLPDIAKDREKAEAVSKVTDVLVKNGWIVEDTQELNHLTAVEYTKLCGPSEIIEVMLAMK